MKVTGYAVQRRLATGAIVVGLVVLGLYGLWRIPVDFLPNITYPMVKIHIWWRGATPEEIVKNIADPIERQMATVDDLDYLESSSIEGMYTLLVNFRYGVDVNVAYQDALAAMARANRELPKEIDPPIVIKADPSQLPVVQLTIRGDEWDLVRLRTWTDEWLQDRMLAVPGVAGTEIVGGLKREIRVHLDPDALDKYGLTIQEVLRRLREENFDQFGGRVTVGAKEIIARTTGEFESLDEIRDVLLVRVGNAKVHIRDVATVEDAHEEARVITRLDGNSCVKLSVLKQDGANTVEVADAVRERIIELEPNLPGGVRIGMVENQADYVISALNGVRDAIWQAAVLVILVVWLFLGSWRQVVVIMTSLPITVIVNFGLMKLAGFSLNIFSLGGLVIAIGILVDNSIIVVETVTLRRKERPDAPIAPLIVGAVREVGPATVAGTLSFLSLLLPFLLVPGLVSLLFRELILVIAGIVAVSLAVSLTVTPMVITIVFGKKSVEAGHRFQLIFERLAERYEHVLSVLIKKRWWIASGFVGILILSVLLAGQLGTEFLSQPDDGRIMIKVRLPTGAALAETDRVLSEIEERIGTDPRIESLFTLAGGKVWGLYTYEIANEGELNIQLVPGSKRNKSTRAIIDELRPIIGQIPVPGGRAMVMQMPIKGIRKLGDADIELQIKGPELDTLFRIAATTAKNMNELNHFTNVYVSMDMTKPEYRIRIDRKRAAELGVPVETVAETIRSLVTGAVATRFREGDEYYGIRVMVPETRIVERSDIEHLPLSLPKGGTCRLSDVAQVVLTTGPVEIVRDNQVKQVIVRGDASGVSVGQALDELRSAMKTVDLPPGYEIKYGGQARMIADMKQTLTGILLFAVFFSFLVLAVQFNSFKLPTLVLAGVPFCLTGIVFLLLATGFALGATIIIGILVVVAAAINDGVLLFTFAQELQQNKQIAPIPAVIEAARIRLRPRVMTTVSTLAGFVPLSFAVGMLQPMAVAAVGGLLMEIVVALFLMPCLYVFGSKSIINQPSEVSV